MLDIDIGDEIFVGRFKNKRITVKSIEMDEKGDLLINGKKVAKFRLPPPKEPEAEMPDAD